MTRRSFRYARLARCVVLDDYLSFATDIGIRGVEFRTMRNLHVSDMNAYLTAAIYTRG